jgi:hypothetical protein
MWCSNSARDAGLSGAGFSLPGWQLPAKVQSPGPVIANKAFRVVIPSEARNLSWPWTA